MSLVSGVGSMTRRLRAVVGVSPWTRGVVFVRAGVRDSMLWRNCPILNDINIFGPADGPIEFVLGEWLLGPRVCDPW